MSNQKVRHILSLSGGKDSTALAIYMLGKIPNVEYIFCDTGEELPETYEYLEKLEAFLGQPIVKLINKRQGFSDLLDARRGFLPSPQVRWCTESLKIKPFEEFVGNDKSVSYVAIRADELHRKGYISTKQNISPRYPFIEEGINKEDVLKILDDSGIGLPSYYSWRSRSGCYFCFYQQRIEWVGLLENHPSLFWKAASLERTDKTSLERYTWNSRESLSELANPDRIKQIKLEASKRDVKYLEKKTNGLLLSIFGDDDNNYGCNICHL